LDTKTNERVLQILLQIDNNGYIEYPIQRLLDRLPELNERLVRASLRDLEKKELLGCEDGDNTIGSVILSDNAFGYFREKEEENNRRYRAFEELFNRPLDTQSRSPVQPIINLNVKENYGAIGHNENVNIYNGTGIDELTRLIQTHTMAGTLERQEVEALRDRLKELEDGQRPMPEGFLSEISAIMQKHSWVTGPTLGFLLQLATKVSS